MKHLRLRRPWPPRFVLIAGLVFLGSQAQAGMLGDLRVREAARERVRRVGLPEALMAPLPAAVASNPIPFTSGEEVALESSPTGIAVADLDGDGRVELATAELSAGVVTIWSPARRETLARYAIPGALRIEAGAFVGDSSPDLVVLAKRSTGAVHVLQGRGDGRFDPTATLAVGRLPEDLASGDFDGDGDFDLAVCSPGDSSVHLLAGSAAGFGEPQLIVRMNDPVCAAAIPRAGAASDLLVGSQTNWQVRLLRRLASGAWTTTWTIQTLSTLSDAVLQDFDGDGVEDLAVLHDGSIEILHGDRGQGFDWRRSVDIMGSPSYSDGFGPKLISSDLDGDGTVELIAGSGQSQNLAWVRVISVLADDVRERVRYYVSTGGLPYPVVTVRVTALAVADLDGDGGRDLVVGRTSGAAPLVLLKQRSGFAYAGLQEYPLADDEQTYSVADVVHFGAHTRDELLISRGARTWRIRFSGAGVAEAVSEIEGGLHDAVLDLNRDGLSDLVHIDADRVAVTLGTPAGPGDLTREYAEGKFLTFGDFDGDGDRDLAWATTESRLRICLNDGAGDFADCSTQQDLTLVMSSADLDAGDLDGDRRDDIVLGLRGDPFLPRLDTLLWLRSTPGGFEPRSTAITPIPLPDYVASLAQRQILCRDMNGDGRADVLVLIGGFVDFGCVAVVLSEAGGAFRVLEPRGIWREEAWLFCADVDADGDLDVSTTLHSSFGDGRLLVLLNDGAGQLDDGLSPGSGGLVPLNAYPGRLALGRFDDGPSPDLAVAYRMGDYSGGAGFGVLLNTLPDFPTAVQVTLLSAQASPDGVALEWRVIGGAESSWRVWREGSDGWRSLGEATLASSDRITFTDREVSPGAIYRYRLRAAAGEWLGEPVEVAVPGAAASFLLSAPHPNPGVGVPHVRYRLMPDEPATLTLHDIAGRTVRRLVIPAGAGGPGRADFPGGGQIEPGIYWVRLEQLDHVGTARVVVLE